MYDRLLEEKFITVFEAGDAQTCVCIHVCVDAPL